MISAMIYEQKMRRFIDRQLLLNVLFSLLIFCVVKFCPLVLGGCFKLLAFLAFASLVAFVVIQFTEFGRRFSQLSSPAFGLFSCS